MAPSATMLTLFLLVLLAATSPSICKMKAMSYGDVFGQLSDTEFISTKSGRALSDLQKLGVDYIAITVYAQQDGKRGQEIRTISDLDNIRYLVGHAQVMGMKTFLKPVVEACCPRTWRGFIVPTKAWYDSYTRWIVDLAEFAEREEVDLFSVGSELVNADNNTATDWKRIVKQVRDVYNGKVTYVANHESQGQVKWWDAVDYVSLSAYYALLTDDKGTAPSVKETIKLWEKKIDEVEEWREQNAPDKKVILAEIGYQSKGGGIGWRVPYDWEFPGSYNEEQQDTLYEASLRAWMSRDWVEGMFWWHWLADPDAGKPGTESRLDYTPQNKKAEKTLKEFYDEL